MKIFLDTANIPAIKEFAVRGIIDGVTTNPTHLSKEHNDPTKQVLEICNLLPYGEISVEVTETDPAAVYKQAREIADLANNILVKVPCDKKYYAIIKQLVLEKIPLNITLVFSLSQGLMMSKLGVRYISPFVGRLFDHGYDGIDLLFQLRHMVDTYGFSTHILAASIRNEDHVNGAVEAGSDAITIPEKVLETIIHHELTDQGMVTFLDDWKKLNITKFP